MLSNDPGKVIVQAHSLGLRALVNLLRERTIKDTNHLHTEAKTKLDNAMSQWYSSLNQNRPNFSKVAILEKKLRDIELENIWTTTACYGNTELKRVNHQTGSKYIKLRHTRVEDIDVYVLEGSMPMFKYCYTKDRVIDNYGVR